MNDVANSIYYICPSVHVCVQVEGDQKPLDLSILSQVTAMDLDITIDSPQEYCHNNSKTRQCGTL